MVRMSAAAFVEFVRQFRWLGEATAEGVTAVPAAAPQHVPTFVNEFWTSKQRDAHSLHEISYRACFKPQLPRFFIDQLTKPGDVVYDPFAGRGTTPLEAALAGRVPIANDINPLTAVLLAPRFAPPTFEDVRHRLEAMDLQHPADVPEELSVFYHPATLTAICSLREHLLDREARGTIDDVDRWIRMVAVNRLTGHSAGFFSVYTLPPNQATSVQAQRKINCRRSQEPPLRDVPSLILKKSHTLLRDCGVEARTALAGVVRQARIVTGPARRTPDLADGTVDLVVTSPPFLDVVRYAADNWLRCWFCGIDADAVPMTIARRLDDWQAEMGHVFRELHRVVKQGGYVAFEVGEVRGGTVRLEETVIPCGLDAGFEIVLVLINTQQFTKTANVWGVSNNSLGTNTNRVVVFRKH